MIILDQSTEIFEFDLHSLFDPKMTLNSSKFHQANEAFLTSLYYDGRIIEFQFSVPVFQPKLNSPLGNTSPRQSSTVTL